MSQPFQCSSASLCVKAQAEMITFLIGDGRPDFSYDVMVYSVPAWTCIVLTQKDNQRKENRPNANISVLSVMQERRRKRSENLNSN